MAHGLDDVRRKTSCKEFCGATNAEAVACHVGIS